MEVHNFALDKEAVERYKIDKIPAIAVVGPGEKDYGVRFYGVPGGYEFGSLIEAIKAVAAGESGLTSQTKEALKGLKRPVHLQVFVTLTCPYCPTAVQLAHRMAIESDLVRAEMVESSEFPHLVQRYGVFTVPKTVINERFGFEGALPEPLFLEEIMRVMVSTGSGSGSSSGSGLGSTSGPAQP
ncbi:TPA: glutaredoxin [Candidatus Bipolaricaulota bacterium]|nr:glutaredoxin [Candidatus Bipolaricaulota bacterium]